MITFNCVEVLSTLTELDPPEGAKPKVETFSVFPDYGMPKTRFVQALCAKMKGPVTYFEVMNPADGSTTGPHPIFGSLGCLAGQDGSEGQGAYFATLVQRALDAQHKVLVFGADRVKYVLTVKSLTDKPRDPLGDVSDVERTNIRPSEARTVIRREF